MATPSDRPRQPQSDGGVGPAAAGREVTPEQHQQPLPTTEGNNNQQEQDNITGNEKDKDNDDDDLLQDGEYLAYLMAASLWSIYFKHSSEHAQLGGSGDDISWEDMLWIDIRNWFRLHTSQEEREDAVSETNTDELTILHALIRDYHNLFVPFDILQLIVETAPTTLLQRADSHGRLVLHHAAGNRLPPQIMALFIKHYPQGLLAQDKHGRIPLHFACAVPENYPGDEAIESVKILMDDEGQAVRTRDNNGMLPIHYACAYSAPVEVIDILWLAYPDSLLKRENNGRTPMHLVMVNSHRQRAPEVLHNLIHNKNVQAIGMKDNDGNLPLHLFAIVVDLANPENEQYVRSCMIQYLNVPNAPKADYLSAILTLPGWLQSIAFANPGILLRDVLNENTAKPIPTMILMLDFYMLIALIIFFQLAVEETIACMYQGIEPSPSQATNLTFIIVAAVYFTVREAFQIFSMVRLGIFFQAWLTDLTNLIDMVCIILTYIWYSKMRQDCIEFDQGQRDSYRSGMAITTGIYWLNFLFYLRATSVDFAVFVGGVLHVLRSLATFLVSLLIVLVAFAQMFYNLSQGTNRCLCNDPNLANMNEYVRNQCIIENNDGTTSSIIDNDVSQKFCSTYQESLLTVYYMMVGQAETEDVTFSVVSTALFCIFMFVAVILLTNILIAIVTESYVFVKDNNSSEVFWSNRFAFLAEVDPINFSEYNNDDDKEEDTTKPDDDDDENSVSSFNNPTTTTNNDNQVYGGERKPFQTPCFSESWKADLWDKLYSHIIEIPESPLIYDWMVIMEYVDAVRFIFTSILLLVSMILWILLGFVTAGLLWPNQIRKYLLYQRIEENDINNDKKSNSLFGGGGAKNNKNAIVSSSSSSYDDDDQGKDEKQQEVLLSCRQELTTLSNEVSELKMMISRLEQSISAK